MKTGMILFIALMISVSSAQEIKVSARTGDADIDMHLSQINKYGKADFEFFKKDMTLKFGASSSEINDYYYKDRINPGDIYYGYTLSSVSGRPVGNIMEMYKKKKGWGEIAKELGIKPGSREFHMMKGKALSGIGKVKSKHIDSRKGGKPKGKK